MHPHLEAQIRKESPFPAITDLVQAILRLQANIVLMGPPTLRSTSTGVKRYVNGHTRVSAMQIIQDSLFTNWRVI
jgi:hypothetical protein